MLGRKDTHEDESGQSGEDVGAQNMQPAHAETESCEWVQCCAMLEGAGDVMMQEGVLAEGKACGRGVMSRLRDAG
jgi:hypothetical protein